MFSVFESGDHRLYSTPSCTGIRTSGLNSNPERQCSTILMPCCVVVDKNCSGCQIELPNLCRASRLLMSASMFP